MLRKIDRYLIKEFVSPFWGGLALFCFILIMDKVLRLIDLMLTKGVGIKNIILLFLYIIPPLLSFIIPMSILFATLLTFGRLASDNEITALLSCGVHPLRLFAPILFLSAIAVVLCLWLELAIIPFSNNAFLSFVSQIQQKKAFLLFDQGEFRELGKGLVMYFKNEEGGKGDRRGYNGILLADDNLGGESRVIFAQRGNISLRGEDGKLNISLEMGNMHNLALDAQKGYDLVKFNKYQLDVALPGYKKGKTGTKAFKESSQGEILRRARSDSISQGERIKLLIEWHRRFAFPFACFIFAFIGALIGVLSRWSGRGIGIAISILLVLIYYFIMIAGDRLSMVGYLPPWLAVWLPNILFTGFCAWGLKEIAR